MMAVSFTAHSMEFGDGFYLNCQARPCHWPCFQEVRLHYVSAGDEAKPLMLMLHGFPECWYSWRYQIVEFKKDYRLVLQLCQCYSCHCYSCQYYSYQSLVPLSLIVTYVSVTLARVTHGSVTHTVTCAILTLCYISAMPIIVTSVSISHTSHSCHCYSLLLMLALLMAYCLHAPHAMN